MFADGSELVWLETLELIVGILGISKDLQIHGPRAFSLFLSRLKWFQLRRNVTLSKESGFAHFIRRFSFVIRFILLKILAIGWASGTV